MFGFSVGDFGGLYLVIMLCFGFSGLGMFDCCFDLVGVGLISVDTCLRLVLFW